MNPYRDLFVSNIVEQPKMKVYRVDSNGMLLCACVPNGAIAMEIGSTHAGRPGIDDVVEEITWIDRNKKTFRRCRNTGEMPFPDNVYYYKDVEWKSVKE